MAIRTFAVFVALLVCLSQVNGSDSTNEIASRMVPLSERGESSFDEADFLSKFYVNRSKHSSSNSPAAAGQIRSFGAHEFIQKMFGREVSEPTKHDESRTSFTTTSKSGSKVVTVKVARSPMATLAPIRVSGPFSASRFVNNWLPPSEVLAVESAPSPTEIPIDFSIVDSIAASSAAKRKSRQLVKQILKPKATVPKPRIVSQRRIVSQPKVLPTRNGNPTYVPNAAPNAAPIVDQNVVPTLDQTPTDVPLDQTATVSDQPVPVPQIPNAPVDTAAPVSTPVEPGLPQVVATKPKPRRVANVVAPTVPFRIKRTKKAVVKPVVARVRKVRERAKLPPRRGVGKPARPPVLVRWPRKPRQAPVVRSDLNSLPVHPVANVLGSGFDGNGAFSLQSAKARVLAFDWVNAVEYVQPRTSFRVPGDISMFDMRQASLRTAEFSSTEEVQTKFNLDASISGSFLCFSFEAAMRFDRTLTRTTTRSTRDTNINMFSQYAAVSASQPPKLSAEFENAINALPEEWLDNPTAYQNIIDRFGSFYVHGVKFGASLTSSVASTRTSESVRDNFDFRITATINLLLFSLSFNVVDIHQSSSSFSSSTTYSPSISNQGGYLPADDSKYEPIGAVHWVESTERAPTSLGFVLRPITDLIINPKKARSLAVAIAVSAFRANSRAKISYRDNPNALDKGVDAAFTSTCSSTSGSFMPASTSQYRNAWQLLPGGCGTVSLSFDGSDQASLFLSPVPGASDQKFEIRLAKNYFELSSPLRSVKGSFPSSFDPSVPHLYQICLVPSASGGQFVAVSFSVMLDPKVVNNNDMTKLVAGPVASTSPSFLARWTKYTLGEITTSEIAAPVSTDNSPPMYFGVGAPSNNRKDVLTQFARMCSFLKAGDGEMSDADRAGMDASARGGKVSADQLKR